MWSQTNYLEVIEDMALQGRGQEKSPHNSNEIEVWRMDEDGKASKATRNWCIFFIFLAALFLSLVNLNHHPFPFNNLCCNPYILQFDLKGLNFSLGIAGALEVFGLEGVWVGSSLLGTSLLGTNGWVGASLLTRYKLLHQWVQAHLGASLLARYKLLQHSSGYKPTRY